jgi:SAM-dependent methyltransferase
VTTERFLQEQLPPPPARVLEVGCGQDATLATALSVAGWDVLAIDPMAPPGGIFRRLLLEDLEPEEGPFDAVVAVRSLHHIPELGPALDKIRSLLRPGGLLAVEEFAWDLADEPTLEWLLDQRRALGVETAATREEHAAEWEAEHLGLHGYEALRRELDARFELRFFSREPHLHRELGGREAEVLERALIDAGTIQALGFRWAGTPPPPAADA